MLRCVAALFLLAHSSALVLNAVSFISAGNGTVASPWIGGIESALAQCTIDCVVLVARGVWMVSFMEVGLGTAVLGEGLETHVYHDGNKATGPMGRLNHHSQLRAMTIKNQ